MGNTNGVDLVYSLFFFGLIVAFAIFLFSTAFKTRDKSVSLKVQGKIEKLFKTQKDKKSLVIELDKILEYVLQEKFKTSLGLGKILKENKAAFSKKDLDNIWQAHKLRNLLVHNIDFEPSQEELRKTVGIFRKQLGKLV